jgi:hypothetical protein
LEKIETQKTENYKNEYDRLRGAMLAGFIRESSKNISANEWAN